jgi:hypothetical protein
MDARQHQQPVRSAALGLDLEHSALLASMEM